MKAIVAEIDGRSMIVITKNGEFVKVKRNMACAVGDEIEYNAPATVPAFRKLSLIAASFLLCAFLGGGIYAYAAPYSYMSLDINPSVSMTLNRFERVIDVKAVNQDGQEVLADIKNLENKDIDTAVLELLKSAEQNGYIKPGVVNAVMFVISTNSPAEEAKLRKIVKEISKANLNVIVENTTVKKHKDALSKKTSPGKLLLTEKLQKLDPKVKESEVEGLSVQQAVDMMEQLKKGKADALNAAPGQLKKPEKQADKDAKAEEKQVKKDIKATKKEAKKETKKEYKDAKTVQNKSKVTEAVTPTVTPTPTPEEQKDKKDKKPHKNGNDEVLIPTVAPTVTPAVQNR